jgi:23S rRNA (cytosine1962-C5)-methyltransferase
LAEIVYKPIRSSGWADYELLDSGDRRKLERFGAMILDRFEPDASWSPSLAREAWDRAHRKYLIDPPQHSNHWQSNHPALDEWVIQLDELKIALKFSESRHIGIFPEQISNWRWLEDTIRQAKKPLNILNLFAYTGIASLYCAKSGAKVTHVDASRTAIELARKSQSLSNMESMPIRWIVDDVFKFVQREMKRENKYDAIILDPPIFGRGPKGEVWKFEHSIDELVVTLKQLLVDEPTFFILTAYNVQEKSDDLAKMIDQYFAIRNGIIEHGPLIQQEKSAGHLLQQALYVRYTFGKTKGDR